MILTGEKLLFCTGSRLCGEKKRFEPHQVKTKIYKQTTD
jgi:hypothetical protein